MRQPLIPVLNRLKMLDHVPAQARGNVEVKTNLGVFKVEDQRKQERKGPHS